jgi:hypothetical protein
MADARSINVKLTIDVDKYVAGIERARAATEALTAELRACGISDADMPSAIKSALRIIKDEDGDPKFAVAI